MTRERIETSLHYFNELDPIEDYRILAGINCAIYAYNNGDKAEAEMFMDRVDQFLFNR